MAWLLSILFLLIILYGPQWQAQATFRRYAKNRDDIPGSGGELARHLLDRFGMKEVGVERTDPGGDHYDPRDKAVRLGPDNYDGRSLTAIAVAAHEVGHAIQDQRGEALLALRGRLLKTAEGIQKISGFIALLFPLVLLAGRSPLLAGILLLSGIAGMFLTTLVHLVTLPVELDASFGKALPVLSEGKYIHERDEAAVRRILRAAAWTYVAASLASLLNIWRWLGVLRRRI